MGLRPPSWPGLAQGTAHSLGLARGNQVWLFRRVHVLPAAAERRHFPVGISLSHWIEQRCVSGSGLSSLLCPAPSEPGKEWGSAPFLLLLGAGHCSPEAGSRGSVVPCLGLGECPHTQAFLRQPVSSQGSGSCISTSPRAWRPCTSRNTLQTARKFHPQGKLPFR